MEHLLAGLLLFASLGFLMENLWDTRKNLTRLHYLSIWAILICNIWQGIVWAMALGFFLALLVFVIEYKARVRALQPPMSGVHHHSTAMRAVVQEERLGILGHWYV